MFGAVDWIVVGIYILAMAILGAWLGLGQKNTRDYFLGSRKVKWWAVGLSIVATETSAATFIGVPALAFGSISMAEGNLVVTGGNMSFIQLIFGYVIARVLLAIIMIPHYFRGEIYSPYDILQRTFGKSPCVLASILFLLAGTFAAGVRVYITAIPIQVITQVSIFKAIVIFTFFAVLYTWMGGIKAVIWTDFIQFLLLFGGGIFAVFYIPTLIDGGWDRILSVAAAEGKLHWLNSGATGAGFWDSMKNIISGPYNIWMGLIGVTIGVLHSHGADQLVVQRILTCEGESGGRKSLIVSAILILPLMLTFLLVGVILFAYYKLNNFSFEIMPVDPDSLKYTADYVFPIFMVTAMPPVIKGLLVSAIFAAAMSSVDSALSALASVSVMDIYKPYFKPNASEKHYLWFSKWTIAFWGALLVVVALLCREVEQVLIWAFKIGGLTTGAILGSVLWAITRKEKAKPGPVVIAMLVSFLVMLFVVVGTELKWINISWPWYAMIGTSVTMIVAAIGNVIVGKPSE